MTVLENTNASAIAAALVSARRNAGSPAMGMVMTLVVVAGDGEMDDALAAARNAAREHPCRLIGVLVGSARGRSAINAEIKAGAGSGGELALIRLEGEVAKHAESVVLPLLLPDSPVVVWWPADAPSAPAEDPLGKLGTRRITDAARVTKGRTKAMLTQCQSYAPGNTDLAWTRITPWRALLAASLEQAPGRVTAIEVAAEQVSPSAELLAAWLADRLRAPVTQRRSDGPGITEVVLTLGSGEIRICRSDGRLATLMVPAQPDRLVALRRRDLPELLTEELRRLDPDDVYEATVRRLAKMGGVGSSGTGSSARRGSRGGARKTSRSGPAGKAARSGKTEQSKQS